MVRRIEKMIVSIYFEFDNKRKILATIDAESIEEALEDAKKMFSNKKYVNLLKAKVINKRIKNK